MSSIRYDCIYSTVDGDTLAAIALRYGVAPFDLLSANSELALNYSLTSQLPRGTRVMTPCQTVTTPQIPFTPCTYIFSDTDTLDRAAQALDTTASRLVYYSNGNNQPVPGTIVAVQGCYNALNNLYITQRGDTLTSIANRFQVPVETLINYNTISGSALTPLPPGQTLVIPPSTTVSRTTTTVSTNGQARTPNAINGNGQLLNNVTNRAVNGQNSTPNNGMSNGQMAYGVYQQTYANGQQNMNQMTM